VFVVGTESGTIVCMGNDFQYTRTKVIDDSNEDVIAVRKILPIDDNKVLISNDDNSLVVLSVPSLEIIDIFDKTWLSKSYGNISFVYVDEPSQLNFVYIGTTRGFLIVLDISNGPIRVCDYLISLDEIGLESHMAIRAIQLCPQDDKFIAIAYRDGEDTEGAILIFDLVKKKTVKHYSTAPITTISWNHTGTALFAGTVDGDVLKIDFVNLTPSEISMVWSYKEYYQDSIDFPVAIRNMQWLPSQDPSSSCLGCLFVSFITTKEDRGELINCIIGIAEINGKVETIFELPKLYNEEVLDFCFVPTTEKDDINSNPVPALCVIFECDNDFDDSYIRVMKTIRCPMGDMNDWPLEIGLLPEPRLPCEILTSNDWVSSIFAMTSSSKKTLATLFLNGTEVHYVDKAIEKEFTSDLELSIDIETELLLSWNIVLSTGSVRSNKNEDVIILGHDNGEVTVWAISNLQLEEKSGLGVYWKKLLTINCGKDPITHINVDDEERLFIAGNSLGIVYVFDMFDVSENIGHIDTLRQRKSTTLSSPLSVPRAFSEDSSVEQNYCIREFSIIDTVEMVTCSLIISDFTTMFLGTKTGVVLACNDMTDESLIEIERIRDFIVPANEKIQNPVTGLVYGAFYRDKLIPVCYVHYKSGHICAIDVHTLEVIAYHYAPLNDEADIYSKAYSKAFGYLLDSDYNIMSGFNSLEIIKESFSVGTRSRGSSVASRESSSDIEQDAPPKPPKPIKNSFFSVVSTATERAHTISIPLGAPRYLMLVVGKYIVMHDLSRLATFDQETGKFGKVDITATSVSSISKHLIINSSTITIDYNGENMEILTIQLFDGRCLLFNPQTRKCIGTCNLLENVEDKYIVENGIFLKNGNCFCIKNGCFIISSNIKFIGNEILNYPSSERVKFTAILPRENLKLDHGRSKSLEAKKTALQKRRQSMITITAGPTDLTKLFSKSRSSLSTNLDEVEVEEIEVEMRGYSPRSVRKKHAAFGKSPSPNRSSNYLSKTSMLLLQMNEETKPEARNKQKKEVIEKNQQGAKLSQKQEQRKEALELLKEAQHYNKFEKKTSLRQGAANQAKMNEAKILLEQRGMKLERSTEKSEETMNAAKQYRDALAEHKKKLAIKANQFW